MQVSLPVRGAWIEIKRTLDFFREVSSSLPVRGAWIEMFAPSDTVTTTVPSLPVRGAWIEIRTDISQRVTWMVAPRAGSVD